MLIRVFLCCLTCAYVIMGLFACSGSANSHERLNKGPNAESAVKSPEASSDVVLQATNLVGVYQEPGGILNLGRKLSLNDDGSFEMTRSECGDIILRATGRFTVTNSTAILLLPDSIDPPYREMITTYELFPYNGETYLVSSSSRVLCQELLDRGQAPECLCMLKKKFLGEKRD